MRKRVSSVNTVLTAALVLLSGFAFSAPRANAQPTDSQATVATTKGLGEQVRHKLITLPWFGVFDNLAYQINGSEVILTGQVTNDVTKSDAAKAVRHIEGVSNVVNNIQVLPLSVFDDQIRRAEYRTIFSQGRLARYAASPIPDIHIIVNGGHVTLEGVVANESDRNVANIMANQVPGVFSVTNNLRVS